MGNSIMIFVVLVDDLGSYYKALNQLCYIFTVLKCNLNQLCYIFTVLQGFK